MASFVSAMSSPLNLTCTRTPAGFAVMRWLGCFLKPGPLLALMRILLASWPSSRFPYFQIVHGALVRRLRAFAAKRMRVTLPARAGSIFAAVVGAPPSRAYRLSTFEATHGEGNPVPRPNG